MKPHPATTRYLVKHETLAVKHNTDPLCAAVDSWVGYLLTHRKNQYQPFQQATHLNLFHVSLRASITKFTT